VLLNHTPSNTTITGPNAVPTWTAGYSASGGNVEVRVDITATEASFGGIGLFYLYKDSTLVDTVSFPFVGNSHFTIPPLYFLDALETGTHTFSVVLGAGSKVTNQDCCLMVVTEY
jgi:hypothetical protein